MQKLKPAPTDEQELSEEEALQALRGGQVEPELSEDDALAALQGTLQEKPGFFSALAGHGLEGLSSIAGEMATVGSGLSEGQAQFRAAHPFKPGGLLAQMEPAQPPQGESPMAGIAAGLRGASQLVYPPESQGRGGLAEQAGGLTGDVLSLAPAMAAGPAAAAFAMGAENAMPLYYEIKAKTKDPEAAGWALLFGNAIAQVGAFGPAKYAGSTVKKLFTGKLGQAIEKTVVSHVLEHTAKGTAAMTAQAGLNDLLREKLTGEDLDNWQRMKEELPAALLTSGAFVGVDALVSGIKRGQLKKPAERTKPKAAERPVEEPAPQVAQEAPREEQPKPSPEVAAPEEAPGDAFEGLKKAAQERQERARQQQRDYPLHSMNIKELSALESSERTRIAADEKRLGITELARRLDAAQRRAGNSGLSQAQQDRAQAEADAIEESLTPEQKRVMFGIGETTPSLEEIRGVRRVAEDVEASDSPAELAASLRRHMGELSQLLERVQQGEDPQAIDLTQQEVEALAAQSAAERKAALHGWDIAEVQKEAAKQFAGRFPDPEDAAFMLKGFFGKKGGEPGPSEGGSIPKLGAPAEPGPRIKPEPAAEPIPKEPSGVQQLYGGLPPILGTEGVGKKAMHFLQGQLRSRGHAPEEARRFLEQAKGSQDAEAIAIRHHTGELKRAAKAAYGPKWLETHGEILDAALKSPERLAALPEAVQKPVAAMRDHIDRLSRRMIESGAAKGPMAEIIESHMGEYVTRVHRAFTDKNWKAKVPEEVKNRLFTLWNSWAQPITPEQAKALEARAREKPPEAVDAMKRRRELNREIAVLQKVPRGTPDGDFAQRKIKLLRQERRGLSFTARRMTEAAKLARSEIRGRREFAGASEEDIKGTMAAILEAAKEKTSNPFAQIAVGKLGRKDLSILRRRKTFPQELRDYLGEIKNPLASYAASVSKIAQVVSLHDAYNNIRDSGLGFWLFEKPSETHDAQISSEGNPTLAPLAGLYTTPEIKKALTELSPKETNVAVKAMMRVNSFIKWGKIVGAPHQIARQFWGNPIQTIRNGHGFALVSPEMIGKVKNSFGNLAEEQRLARLGISGESIHAEEFKTLREAQQKTPEEQAALANNAWGGILQSKALMERAYQFPDEIQRRMGFYAEEKLRLEEGMSPAAAEEAAANFVRDHYPTWSRVAPILRTIRKTGFLGGYMAFKGEQYRNFGNLVSTIYEEIHSSNPKVKARGYKRIASAIASYSIMPAAALAWNGLNGTDQDEDQLRKQFVPPGDKDGQLAWKGNNLKGSYTKVSDTDPGSMFTNPLVSLASGKKPMEVFTDFARDQRDTFFGLSPVTDLMVNIATITALGTDLNGKPQDSLPAYVGEQIQPGFIQQARRGAERGYGSEILSLFTGSRSYDYDVEKSLGIETTIFSRRLSDNTRAMHRKAQDADKEKSKYLYDQAETERRRLFNEFHDKVKAASDLGLPRYKLEKMLNGALSDEAASAVLRGGYLPYDEAKYQEKKAKAQ